MKKASRIKAREYPKRNKTGHVCRKYAPKPTLKGAIVDEKGAVPMYTSLKNATQNKTEKHIYSSIIRDERKHRRLLLTIQKHRK